MTFLSEINTLREDKRIESEDMQSVHLDEDKGKNIQLGLPMRTTNERSSYVVTSEANRLEGGDTEGVQYVFKKILTQDNQDIILVGKITLLKI